MGYAVTKLEVINGLSMLNCCQCGTPFAVEALLLDTARQTHKTFYCPNGHSSYYPALSDAEKLRLELAARECTLAKERQLRIAAEKETVRLKRRISKGVCPCCKRSFVNMRRHMETKHPEMGKKEPTQI